MTQNAPAPAPTEEPKGPEYPPQLQQLLDRFPDCAVPNWRFADGIPTAAVPPAQLVEVVRWLRAGSDARFDMLVDVSGSHWPARPLPFEVTYILHSLTASVRLRLKCAAGGDTPTIPSLANDWPVANWPEREIYDLFGVTFDGHPDMRRIVTPNDWEGHPLRKDFPLGEEPVEFYRPPNTLSVVNPAAGSGHHVPR